MFMRNRKVYVLTGLDIGDEDSFWIDGIFWDYQKAHDAMMALVDGDSNFDREYEDRWEINDYAALSDPDYEDDYRSEYRIEEIFLPAGEWDKSRTIYVVKYQYEYGEEYAVKFVTRSEKEAKEKWREEINGDSDFSTDEDETEEDLGIFIDEGSMYADSNYEYLRDWEYTTIINVEKFELIV